MSYWIWYAHFKARPLSSTPPLHRLHGVPSVRSSSFFGSNGDGGVLSIASVHLPTPHALSLCICFVTGSDTNEKPTNERRKWSVPRTSNTAHCAYSQSGKSKLADDLMKVSSVREATAFQCSLWLNAQLKVFCQRQLFTLGGCLKLGHGWNSSRSCLRDACSSNSTKIQTRCRYHESFCALFASLSTSSLMI